MMTEENKKATEKVKMAVVLVRGTVKMTKKIKDTLQLLRLTRKNHCVVVEKNAVNLGMTKKVRDFVTYGEIDEKTYQELFEKRGQEYKGRLTDAKKKYSYKTIEYKGKKYKPYFCLNPPRKGFGRKGIKYPFNVGGALGYRGEKMNDLVMRMI